MHISGCEALYSNTTPLGRVGPGWAAVWASWAGVSNLYHRQKRQGATSIDLAHTHNRYAM